MLDGARASTPVWCAFGLVVIAAGAAAWGLTRGGPPAEAAESVRRGERVYHRHGCSSCHGEAGAGLHDLRPGTARYRTDAELIAFIKDPQATRPGIAMPGWTRVIPEEDFPPLAAYLRTLPH